MTIRFQSESTAIFDHFVLKRENIRLFFEKNDFCTKSIFLQKKEIDNNKIGKNTIVQQQQW